MNSKYNLTISSWNVNGLMKKINDTEFLQMITKYDVVCLSETWTTGKDNVNIQSFTAIHVPSVSKNRGRKSGGIVVYIKSIHTPGIVCSERKTNLIWINLASAYFGWDEDIYLAAIYCPPQASQYNNNQLDILMNDITEFSSNGKILIMGDLNARVGGRQIT